jgi:O-antigen biosynthesis protein
MTQGCISPHAKPALAFLVLCGVVCSSSHFSLSAQTSSPQAQFHAEKGIQAARAGDLPTAELQLREAAKLAPNDSLVLSTLGSILGMQRKLQEASLYFERAVNVDANNVEVRRHLAATQFQLGKSRDARKNLEVILTLRPNDPQTLLLAGLVAENLKDYSTAVRWLTQAPELLTQRPEAQLALARSYYGLGQREDARGVLQKISGRSTDSKLVFAAGQEALAAKDYAIAEALLLSAQPSYRDKASLGYNLARVWYETRRYAQAEKALSDLIARPIESGPIYNLLGWSQYRQGRLEEAVRTLHKAIGAEPHKEEHYLDLGRLLAEKHEGLNSALPLADAAVQRFPNSYQAHQLKGLIQSRLQHHRDAIECYSRARKLNPSAPEVNARLALAQWGAGLTEEALATFEQGLKQFPKDAEHLREYAGVLLKKAELGDRTAEDRAVSLLKKAISLDNSQFEPFYLLGNLALAKGNAEEALELLGRASELDVKDSRVHFALSKTYRRLGRQPEADREFQLYQKYRDEQGLSAKN